MKKREWQEKASKEIGKALNTKNSVVSIAACVGSGKTNVAWDAMDQFISKNPNSKTLQVFVCPRISLCNQQALDAQNYLGNKVQVLLINSNSKSDWTQEELEKLDTLDIKGEVPQGSNNFVLVFCDASLWGDAEGTDQSDSHLNQVYKFLDKCKEDGFKLGVIAYDEAHNYRNRQVAMFGKEYN